MALTPQKKSGPGLYQPLSEINVTPLVDVMLVLLIVFMVTAPMLASGMHINLPQAKSAAPLKPNETVVVAIDKDGKIAINGSETAPDVLVDTVRARLVGHEDQPIYLKGDREVPYGAIISVMDQLAGNGLTKIAVVADRKAAPVTQASAK